MTNAMLWRIVPLIHAAIFATFAVAGRIVLVAAKGETNPLSISGKDSARELIARCFYLWLPMADGLFLIASGVSGESGPPIWMAAFAHDWIRWLGLAYLVGALVWVVLSQAEMGSSWRMGVDDHGPARLVTTGPFSLSRHPVYLGIRATMLGQLLVIGTWPILTCWVASELLVHVQVRFEEKSMLELHGQRYAAYCSRVRRWL